MLNTVEKLVRAGGAVHLLKRKSKAPLIDSWSTASVASFEKLERTYKDGMNLGIRTGKWSKIHGYYLHIIDLDIRRDSEADEAREQLEIMFPEFESFPRVQSGSMGLSRHYYIVSDQPFRSKKLAHSTGKIQTPDGKWHWDWEIELFGTGKQAAIPPSIHPDTGKPYRWEKPFAFGDLMIDEGPIVEAHVLEMLTGSGAQDESGIDDERIAPLGMSEDEIREIIAKLPKDDYVEDRYGWLNIGMAVHHETGGSEEGFKIWCECSKQSEKFDKKDQKRVWKSFKNRGRPFRMASLITVVREIELEDEIDNLDDTIDDFDQGEDAIKFDDLGPEPEDEFKDTKRAQKLKKSEVEADLGNVPSKIKRLNRRYALTRVKGKTIVIEEKDDGSADFGTLSSLHEWHENDRVPTEKTTEPVSKFWMRHKKRRQYPEGIGFYPNQDTPGRYNLWRGFSVKPDDSKSCDLFLDHLKNIVCNGNQEHFDYMVGWLAHMIQKPEEKPGVAVVLRGNKGAGKDTVANYVGRMFTAHYMMVSQQRHLTGNFNAHQEKVLLLHVEEGFWAGGKSEEGALKSLITSEFATIERKGIDAIQVNSVLRVFMSSNEKWVVPASADERRYFVLDINPAYTVQGARKAQRADYFKALKRERDKGGPAALLAYLQAYDISDFEVRDVPETLALADQKMAGLKGPYLWWSEQLVAGELEFDTYHSLGPRHGEGDWYSSTGISAMSDTMHDAYVAWHSRHRYSGNIESRPMLFRSLHEMVPDLVVMQVRREDNSRQRFNRMPSLYVCRSHFEEFMNSTFNWSTERIEEISAEEFEGGDDFDNLDEDEV